MPPGDVCVKPLRQVVTAVGDGALAATELERLCAAMQAKTGLHPQQPVSRAEEAAAPAEAGSTLFTGDMLSQLHTVFARMASPLILRLFLDETPLSAELRQYMEELAAQSGKLSVELGDPAEADHLPCVRVCRADGSWTGLAFHGVPGGHEFTSFVLGLYNAAGPGQALDEESRAAIQAIQKPVDLQVLVSLSCTMCPELVTAAQRLAAENPNITAQVYDLNHFPDLREKYQVMSVPCLVVNGGEQVSFGKKNVRQLLELLDLTEPAVPGHQYCAEKIRKEAVSMNEASTVFGLWLGRFAVLCVVICAICQMIKKLAYWFLHHEKSQSHNSHKKLL